MPPYRIFADFLAYFSAKMCKADVPTVADGIGVSLHRRNPTEWGLPNVPIVAYGVGVTDTSLKSILVRTPQFYIRQFV
jgi:hypothetical protein